MALRMAAALLTPLTLRGGVFCSLPNWLDITRSSSSMARGSSSCMRAIRKIKSFWNSSGNKANTSAAWSSSNWVSTVAAICGCSSISTEAMASAAIQCSASTPECSSGLSSTLDKIVLARPSPSAVVMTRLVNSGAVTAKGLISDASVQNLASTPLTSLLVRPEIVAIASPTCCTSLALKCFIT